MTSKRKPDFDVSLVIPFESDEPTRMSAYSQVRAVIDIMYPFHSFHVVGDTHGLPFNRGRARNTGMRRAMLAGADVVVVLDADSIPQRDPLFRAIDGAMEDGKVHFPFDTVHQMAMGNQSVAYTYGPSAGGCWVTRPTTWWEIGGMDERPGWSGDDRTFLVQMRTFDRGPVHHPGMLTCLYHDRSASDTPDPNTRHIISEYLNIEGDRDKLLEYLRSTPGRIKLT